MAISKGLRPLSRRRVSRAAPLPVSYGRGNSGLMGSYGPYSRYNPNAVARNAVPFQVGHSTTARPFPVSYSGGGKPYGPYSRYRPSPAARKAEPFALAGAPGVKTEASAARRMGGFMRGRTGLAIGGGALAFGMYQMGKNRSSGRNGIQPGSSGGMGY